MMSKTQARLRRWFRDHGWSTGSTPTGRGAFLETPSFKGANYVGSINSDGTQVPEDKQYRWHTEYTAQMEIDRFGRDLLEINVFKNTVFTAGPDFEKKNKPWSRKQEVSIAFSHKELQKLLDLMEACKQEEFNE